MPTGNFKNRSKLKGQGENGLYDEPDSNSSWISASQTPQITQISQISSQISKKAALISTVLLTPSRDANLKSSESKRLTEDYSEYLFWQLWHV